MRRCSIPRDDLSPQLARRQFFSAFQAIFDTVDVMMLPTLPVLPFAAEADAPEGWPEAAVLPWIDWAPFTYPFNLAGDPAATLLAAFTSSGLQAAMPAQTAAAAGQISTL